MKKEFAAMSGGSHIYAIQVRNWNGKHFKDGKRYGDDVIAEYFIKMDGPEPKFVKNEKFKPYRELGWGNLDWEKRDARKGLGLNREPTEAEIKLYFESNKVDL